MGNIIKILDTIELPDWPSLQASRITVEKCENIHLHYRNKRLEFSEDEFNFFVDKMIEAKEKLKTAPEETEFHSLIASLELEEKPIYYPNRLQIEANIGAIHLHYKNLRLEFTKDEFKLFGQTITRSLEELSLVNLSTTKLVPLEDINPFDAGHYLDPNDETKFICHKQKEHEDHIEKIKKAILDDKKIRPIVVSLEGPPYQRMDGFCRYWAHKELVLKKIETIICPLAYAGCQDKKHFIISKEEYNKILNGEHY